MRFGDARAGLNNPDLYSESEELSYAIHFNATNDQANPVFESLRLVDFYIKVYSNIERVAKAQWRVFEETTLAKHSMVRDSLRRNLCSESAISDPRCELPMDKFAEDEAKPFITLRRKDHSVAADEYIGHCPMWVAAPDGTLYAGTMPFGIPTLPGGRVFQVETVDPKQIEEIEKQGWEIKHGWTAHPTYFKVDFPIQSGTPSGSHAFVYGRVTISGGKVWPEPTPKFHTRLNACRKDSDCSGQ